MPYPYIIFLVILVCELLCSTRLIYVICCFFCFVFLSCFLFSLSSCCVLYLMLNVFLVCPLLIALRFSPTFIYQAKYWACLLCKVAVVNLVPLCCLFMQLMKFCTRQPLSYLCSVNLILSTFTKYSWNPCHVNAHIVW